ncbi:MAG: Zn-dependent alcohol dehydrogenase [bacterium]|nr:Zn-dependent alcohol dehydrogenase [bacterium]
MKAAVCRAFGEPLVIEDLVLDPPQAGELRVKIAACAICHSDIHYAEGAWGGTLPAVYGHEAAGEVIEAGPGVGSPGIGDPVIVSLIRSCGDCFYCDQGMPTLCEAEFPVDRGGRLHRKDGTPVLQGLRTGAFAEEVVVHHSQVVAVPRSMPLESASLLACGVITGYGAVASTARMPAGSTCVVIGAGGVGLNSIQGAAICGARQVIAVDVLAEKLESALSFGATATVNGAEDDVGGAVRRLTGGRGADYVFITVGSARAMEEAMDVIRPGGTAVIVGMPAVGETSAFETQAIAGAGQRILGSKMGSTRLRVDVPRLVDLYREGRLKLDELITRTYPLDEINEAIAAVKRGEALRNVIVF